MKKLVTLALACIMLITFVACGETKPVSDFEPVTTPELTEEQAVAIFKNAQECILDWYGLNEEKCDKEDLITKYSDYSKREENYWLVKGDVDTLAELKAIWSNSVSEETYEILIGEVYTEEDGKLYFNQQPFGIEEGYHPQKLILEPNERGYSFTMTDFICSSMGELYYSDATETFQFVNENGKWVVDGMYVYDLRFDFGEPEGEFISHEES